MKNISIFILAIIFIFSCSKESSNEGDFSSINLKWNKSYPSQTRLEVLQGLNWTLSNVGVSLKSQAADYLIIKNEIIELKADALNFESSGRQSLINLHKSIYNSEEYRVNNSIDVGRYICLLIGASNHYFQLVGIPNSLSDILSKYQTLPDKGKINNSNVSFVDRIIEYSLQENGEQLFLSTEVDSASNTIYEYETIEIMNNGQLKFGIYDKDGNRKKASNTAITSAGKIAKCMWCHESNFAPIIGSQSNEMGFLPAQQFKDTLQMYRQKLFGGQINLSNSVVDYNQLQEHTKMELLYISFMHPSAERLSNEWNMSLTSVLIKLRHLSTHRYNEFPFLGRLYNREDVEQFSPFKGLEVSSSVREESVIEVNHL